MLDKPLQLLGQALGPMALLLVGVTLAFSTVGAYFGAALRIALVKNLVFPAVLVFIVLLAVGFVYDWRKGIFQWR